MAILMCCLICRKWIINICKLTRTKNGDAGPAPPVSVSSPLHLPLNVLLPVLEEVWLWPTQLWLLPHLVTPPLLGHCLNLNFLLRILVWQSIYLLEDNIHARLIEAYKKGVGGFSQNMYRWPVFIWLLYHQGTINKSYLIAVVHPLALPGSQVLELILFQFFSVLSSLIFTPKYTLLWVLAFPLLQKMQVLLFWG